MTEAWGRVVSEANVWCLGGSALVLESTATVTKTKTLPAWQEPIKEIEEALQLELLAPLRTQNEQNGQDEEQVHTHDDELADEHRGAALPSLPHLALRAARTPWHTGILGADLVFVLGNLRISATDLVIVPGQPARKLIN